MCDFGAGDDVCFADCFHGVDATGVLFPVNLLVRRDKTRRVKCRTKERGRELT